MSRWNQYDHSQMSPCKDCEDRHRGCHDRCEAYKDFRNEIDKANAQRHEATRKEHEFRDYKILGVIKEQKRKRHEH